jgi:hypothetical protein
MTAQDAEKKCTKCLNASCPTNDHVGDLRNEDGDGDNDEDMEERERLYLETRVSSPRYLLARRERKKVTKAQSESAG